ncbi:MAG: hypothetical protein WCK77_24095 [Verrucomicrobiota bacterium]
MWLTLTAADVSAQLSDAESAAVLAALGANTKLPALVANVIQQIRGDIRAGGYAMDATTTTLPAELLNDAVAIIRWKLLMALPGCEYLMTPERKDENKEARGKCRDIAARKRQVELPNAQVARVVTGNWNSENKILPRLHPVPRPGIQGQPTPPGYGNADADAPVDQS